MRVPREPADDLEREAAVSNPPRQAPADRVLALQTTAGNRAVSALLARDPNAPTPTDAKTPKDKPPPAPTGPHVVLGDLGPIGIESWSMSSPRPGRPGGKGQDMPDEIYFTSRGGDYMAKLADAAARGTQFDGEVITSHLKLKFKGGIVSGYNISGEGENQTVTWSLNISSLEYEVPPQKDEDGPKGGRNGWDPRTGRALSAARGAP